MCSDWSNHLRRQNSCKLFIKFHFIFLDFRLLIGLLVILTNHITGVNHHSIGFFIIFFGLNFWFLLLLVFRLFVLPFFWLSFRKTQSFCEECYDDEDHYDDEEDTSKNNECDCEGMHLWRRSGCSIINRNHLNLQNSRFYFITNLKLSKNYKSLFSLQILSQVPTCTGVHLSV